MKLKKLSCLLVPFAAISASVCLSSCGGSNNPVQGPVFLDYGYYSNKTFSQITELSELSYEELNQKIQYQESFVLALYLPGQCGCWEQFSEILAQYLNTSHILINYINMSKFEGKNSFGLNLDTTKAPYLAIFNKGQLVIQCNKHNVDERIFNRLDYLTNFINEKTYAPVMYNVDTTTLDELITNNTEFNLLYSRYTCPDCNDLKKEVILPWVESFRGTNNKKLFVFDDVKFSSEQRTELKEKYGLTETSNPTLGWNTGYVPSIQHRKGNEILDMITVNNDYPGMKGKTYFSKDRLQYLTFLKDDTSIENKVLDEGFDDLYGTEAYRKTYHNPISRLFLKTYCE
ncbi:MAG: hypothetical protein MJ225_02775 [Bacilli bacterium]|nr:hypothetical protein [Bacilli bacterium]